MSCTVFQELWDTALENPVAKGASDPLEDHARACDECAELLSLVSRLERGRKMFDAPDPPRAYWSFFSRRLRERLEKGGSSSPLVPTFRVPAWSARLSLAFAALGLFVIAVLAVQHRPRIARSVSPAPHRWTEAEPSREAELLERLGQAGVNDLDEVLDGVIPANPPLSSADLASALGMLADPSEAELAPATPYDLFLDMPAIERSRLMEEMRGEIG